MTRIRDSRRKFIRPDQAEAPSIEPESRLGFLVGHELRHLADWRDGQLFRGLFADPAVRQRLEDWADEFGREIEKELKGT